MLHQQYRIVALVAANSVVKKLILDYFGQPNHTSLMPALLQNGLGQADLVLCLLRLRDRHHSLRQALEIYIEMFIGRPINIGPRCLLNYNQTSKPRVSLDRSPRITFVHPTNPRSPNTDAYLRWPEYKLGRSVNQLRARGLKPKDIRLAKSKGWIKLAA